MNANTNPKTFAIGDTIYYIAAGAYEGAFEHKRIVGETGRSWIVTSALETNWESVPSCWTTKIPKGAKGYRFGTQRDAELCRWTTANLYNVGHAIERGFNGTSRLTPEIILQVAKLIGYTPLPEEV